MTFGNHMNPLRTPSIIKFSLLVGIFLILLGACSNKPAISDGQIASIHTQVAQVFEITRIAQSILKTQSQETAEMLKTLTPVSTATPQATLTMLPSLTYTLSPSPNPSETPTSTATETPTSGYTGGVPEDAIVFYLTILNTGGSIGCGDTLVKLTTGRTRSGDIPTDLKIALDTLFSAGQYSGGAYNATYPSSLRVDQVNLTLDGTANVYLSGNYVKPADSCDASRYRSQVWATALQFKEIVRFIPFVGNSLLGDRLAVYSDGGG